MGRSRSNPRRPASPPASPQTDAPEAIAEPANAGAEAGSRRFPALDSALYRRFLLAASFGTVGGFMQGTSQGWLVLVLTNSPALLGLAGAAAGAPTLLIAVFAGVLADRLDRRKLLMATSLSAAACAAVLALLTTTGTVEFWHVVVLAFLGGVALTVQLPAWQAVVSSIVSPTSIGNAVALNSAQYNLGRIIAPAVAGLLIAAGGIAIGFWVNAVALAIVAVLVGGLAIPHPRDADRLQAALWRDLQDGIRYVAANRVLTILVLLPAAPALFVLNYITFTPVYARDILGTGPVGLGLLTGSIGVGALAGALSLAMLRPSGGSGRLLLTGLAIAGASLLTFAESRFVPLSMVALAILGTCQVMYYSTTNTLIQILVPARLRGRVLSLYLLTSIGLIPVANLVGGAIANVIGVPTVLGFGGLITIAIAVGVALAEPRLGQLRAEALARTALAERDSQRGGWPSAG